MSPLSARFQAAVAVAKADGAEYGFALSTAWFIGSPIDPVRVHYVASAGASHDADEASDRWLAQLSGGRERIVAALRERVPSVPDGTITLLTFMEPIAGTPSAVVEAWQHGRVLARGFMPLRVAADHSTEFGDFELVEIAPELAQGTEVIA